MVESTTSDLIVFWDFAYTWSIKVDNLSFTLVGRVTSCSISNPKVKSIKLLQAVELLVRSILKSPTIKIVLEGNSLLICSKLCSSISILLLKSPGGRYTFMIHSFKSGREMACISHVLSKLLVLMMSKLRSSLTHIAMPPPRFIPVPARVTNSGRWKPLME